ncbi:MAG: DUF58 domain-containing protein [Anaerolineales bacterium]|nr:DUF58 domain-containing protein [Anaerolineales bacterium]
MIRLAALALLAFLLFLAGLIGYQPGFLLLALPLVAYLLAGLWGAPERVYLEANRSLSAERIHTGDQVVVTLTVTNRGALLEEVLLEDRLPDGLEVIEGSARRLVRLPAGGSVSWSYRLGGRRGYYALQHLAATVGETLGVRRVALNLETDGQLFILPPVLRLRRISIRPRRTRVYSGTIPARQGGPGVEFFDVREFQSGDSPRQINWRVTARQQEATFTNQYEQERVVDVDIVLDGRRRANQFGEHSIFEHSVLAAAALADAFLAAGNRVGLIFYGQHVRWTMPGYGKVQGEKILHALSQVEPGDSQVFGELYVPRRMLSSRSQLVVVSPLCGEDFQALADLRARGYAVLAVSPAPVDFEVAGLPLTESVRQATRIARMKRQVLLRRLAGIGIQIVDWDVALPFEQVARRALERRPPVLRGLIR